MTTSTLKTFCMPSASKKFLAFSSIMSVKKKKRNNTNAITTSRVIIYIPLS